MLSPVIAHLSRLGIKRKLRFRPPASEAEVADAEKEFAFPMPFQMREIFRSECNGFDFSWEDPGNIVDLGVVRSPTYGVVQMPRHPTDGEVELPALPELVELRRPYVNFSFEGEDPRNFRVKDHVLAGKTVQKMKNWLPFWEECSGDQICVDVATARVVFNEHDWFDGGSGDNGHVMAPDLMSFLRDWSMVCFSAPCGNWWPETFSNEGIAWTAENFDARYMLRGN